MSLTPVLSVIAPPLRLVRVGALSLNSTLQVQNADANALSILATSERAMKGKQLLNVVPPASTDDIIATSAPFTYLGRTHSLSAQVLVSVTELDGTILASVTSVNEYLAESQALAHVQLRKTVESIIAGFAHEVRNPMAAILSLTEAAMAQTPEPDTVLVRIPSLVARVEGLLKQALAYSRPRPPRRALHHVSALIEHAVALLRPREDKPRLTVDQAGKVSAVLIDLAQGEQVLVNLLENALDAANRAVRIEVTEGKTLAPSICITVHDDGAGVAPDVAPRIFDPFFTTKAQGTGLGLAIARDLSRLNGGDLRLATTSSTGSAFQMFLPCTAVPLLGPEPE